MSQENLEIARYGLYALTVVLGILLGRRIIRSRNQSEDAGGYFTQAAPAQAETKQDRNPVIEAIPDFAALSTRTSIERATQARGSGVKTNATLDNIPSGRSMATVLTGIRLPLHWLPEHPEQVSNPVRLTSTTDSPSEMATTIANELDRLGFTVTGTGSRSAMATKDTDFLDVEIIPNGSSVTTQIALSEAGNG